MNTKVQRARFLANLLDQQFSIGGIRFGIEPILGFIPAVGDIIGLLLSLYIYRIAQEMQIPRRHRAQMLFNILLDVSVGVIPLLGDIFDVAYKANVRNLHILEKHMRGEAIEGEIVT